MAFPDKPPIRVERIFTSDGAYVPSNGAWRSMYNSSEPRIEISKEAAIRTNGCAWLPETGEQPRGGVALITHGQTAKTAEARIWTFDFSGMPLKSKVHLGNGASITHAFRPGDIQSPAGPASL